MKNPTKIEEIQEKNLLTEIEPLQLAFWRDSNPNYQCLKITSCRWRPPPRMHSFTATTHFKFPVLLCHPVCVARSAECDSVWVLFTNFTKDSHSYVGSWKIYYIRSTIFIGSNISNLKMYNKSLQFLRENFLCISYAYSSR